jgi:hypothetical protein
LRIRVHTIDCGLEGRLHAESVQYLVEVEV